MEGAPHEELGEVTKKYGFLMTIVAVTLFTLLTVYSDENNLVACLIATLACVLVLGFVFTRSHPYIFRQFFDKKAFHFAMAREEKCIKVLETFDDETFIFNNIIFELFRIEHLVICPGGIFVIHKIGTGMHLQVQNKELFDGNSPLITVSNTLWRVCHLIHIVLKKGFKIECMPMPLIVAMDSKKLALTDYNGIKIVPLTELSGLIASHPAGGLSLEMVHCIAVMIKNKYSPA